MSRPARAFLALAATIALSACEERRKDAAAPQRAADEIPPPPDVAAPPPEAERTASGLASMVIRSSTSTVPPPTINDAVSVHYTGWTTDGKMFDSSIPRRTPVTFMLTGVIPGWSEGVQHMRVGEKRRLWIPEDLAYKGAPDQPKGMLVFDIELLSITRGKDPYPPPADLTPPASAQKTASGLAYQILSKGSATERPNASSRVKVDYVGWTSDGKVFDSNRMRGAPALLPLGELMPGWIEGVQLMSPGDRFRFWIPEQLAFAGKPGAPAGMLVFEIELLSFQ